jgi:hypothetical protein
MAKVSVDPDSPAFDSLDEAAKALSAKFDKKSGFENAGMLYKDSAGKFRYSNTLPGRNDQFEMHVLIPKGHTLAAIVHSHPGADADGQVFSPDDVDMAHRLNLPSYVNFLKDDSVRKYVPGVTPTRAYTTNNSRIPRRVADGDPLEQQPQPAQTAQAAPPSDVTQLVVLGQQ